MSESPSVDPGDAIVGGWRDAEGQMIVEFYPCGERYCGRITAIADAEDTVDLRNPDRSLRGRSLIGLEIIEGLRFEPPHRYVRGTMYAPQRGMYVGVSFEITSDDRMTATVSRLLFRRKVEWTRVSQN